MGTEIKKSGLDPENRWTISRIKTQSSLTGFGIHWRPKFEGIVKICTNLWILRVVILIIWLLEATYIMTRQKLRRHFIDTYNQLRVQCRKNMCKWYMLFFSLFANRSVCLFQHSEGLRKKYNFLGAFTRALLVRGPWIVTSLKNVCGYFVVQTVVYPHFS